MSRLNTNDKNGFRFTLSEFIGSLGDLGTLLPLLIGLVVFSGLNATLAITVVGIMYILAGTYYRLPVPIQPLKATVMIAIAAGASAGQVRAAALWMGLLFLTLSVSRLADKLNAVFPVVLIRGLQLGLGLMMIRSGIKFIQSYPQSLYSTIHGVHSTSGQHSLLPSLTEFQSALFLLVLPQIPLTIGNSIIATRDCARKYFGPRAKRVTASRLAATIGLGNLAAGLVGGMPMCHGAGGMTAHYHLGARTGGAGVMLGTCLLLTGVCGGDHCMTMISALPAWLLGVPLAYVGFRHAMLAKDAFEAPATAACVLVMGFAGFFLNNLLAALGAGLAVKFALQHAPRLAAGIIRKRQCVVKEVEL